MRWRHFDVSKDFHEAWEGVFRLKGLFPQSRGGFDTFSTTIPVFVSLSCVKFEPIGIFLKGLDEHSWILSPWTAMRVLQ